MNKTQNQCLNICKDFSFQGRTVNFKPHVPFFNEVSAFSHCCSMFRSCMVEESGTLESQLEATKVSDVHLWLKQHFQLAWEHRVGREMHVIV